MGYIYLYLTNQVNASSCEDKTWEVYVDDTYVFSTGVSAEQTCQGEQLYIIMEEDSVLCDALTLIHGSHLMLYKHLLDPLLVLFEILVLMPTLPHLGQ